MVKVVTDRTVAAVLIVVLAPLLALVSLCILAFMGSPVFFRQRRPGYRGQLFDLLKFRTMTDARASDGSLLPDSVRLTPFGRFLRASSVDELPQLINILRGELSFVGPRPLLVQYLSRYTPEQARRHEVLPGITGWAQVKGRNALSWSKKFALDVWYVDHWSLFLDLQIVLRTISSMIKREGITHPGQATMPEFLGIESDRQEQGGVRHHSIRDEES